MSVHQKNSMQEGDLALNFQLESNDGKTISLDSYKNKKNVVLCFYPKNHLFACPSKKIFKMAKSVIAAYPEIVSTESELFAISIDTVEDQRKFVTEYGIPYRHLSDPQKETCKKYAGLNLAGLAKRSTFIIDRQGVIKKIFRNIDVDNHGKEIANFLKEL
ncbi:MAG: redoxin domain-containing protein [Nitrosopumilaceae archaeon]